MRILCVLLPHFPLVCEVRRNPDLKSRPAIVTYTEGSQKLVMDGSPEFEGLQPGMPLQQALSRHRGTHNVVINQVKSFSALDKVPQSKDWRYLAQ